MSGGQLDYGILAIVERGDLDDVVSRIVIWRTVQIELAQIGRHIFGPALVDAGALLRHHISEIECVEQFHARLMYADHDRQSWIAASKAFEQLNQRERRICIQTRGCLIQENDTRSAGQLLGNRNSGGG